MESEERGPPHRKIEIRRNESIYNPNAPSNTISTTKYSLLSFVPKSIFLQFRHVANLYFLLISLLMVIGILYPQLYESPLEPYSTIIPLCIVLSVTCIKEGVEDLERYRGDRADNHREVIVVRFSERGEAQEYLIATEEIMVGDIVKLEGGRGPMQVPVDMVLILTSNHDDDNQCYIETANIDGETNLKVRQGPPALQQLMSKDGSDLLERFFDGTIEVEEPHEKPEFTGALHLRHCEPQGGIPLTKDNLVMRSAVFTNTEFAYGVAVYTGWETKVQLNFRSVDSKMSTIQKLANMGVIVIFLTKVLVVTLAVAALYMGHIEERSYYTYVYPDGNGDSILPVFVEQWFIFFILFNNMIPISLNVSLELINMGQAYLISSDVKMYTESLDTTCIVRSSNMCQEIGMVSNVFSDKTGTLTCNEMKLISFTVNENTYSVVALDDIARAETDNGEDTDRSRLAAELTQRLKTSVGRKTKEYHFLRCLITCHTVVREKAGTYRAESPDELALVEGISAYECFLHERTSSSMSVTLVGQKIDFEIVAVNHFTSSRKRMSVLIREKSTGQYYVVAKGAETEMLKLCELSQHERTFVDSQLQKIAKSGLRTLCIAHKRIATKDAKAWVEEYHVASTSVRNREEKLRKVAANLEADLDLLGITAIEDRLQDEVPEVLADISRAGVVVWMLTGDKEETAIEIGRSCNLVTPNSVLFHLTNITDRGDYLKELREHWNSIHGNWHEERGFIDTEHVLGADIVLVMDGPSLHNFNVDDPESRKLLLLITEKCRSVIACRLMPRQKQLLVGLVKKDTKPKAITLAIGDGANDVSMIREADIGIGIIGKEGKQAANCADMAIGEFKHLRRLMLVHGRWNYIRLAKAFLYSIHKNLVIAFTLVYFSALAAWSGTSPYESYIYTGYNFALALPIIIFAITDKDISEAFVLKNPQTYITGRTNAELSLAKMIKWIVNSLLYAALHSVMSYIVCWQSYQDLSLYAAGTIVYLGLLQAMQFKVSFMHNEWHYLSVIAMFVSIGGTFAVLWGLNSTQTWGEGVYFGVFDELARSHSSLFFGIGGFLMPLICVCIDVVDHSLELSFFPSDVMLFKEIERDEKKNRYRLPLPAEEEPEKERGLELMSPHTRI